MRSAQMSCSVYSRGLNSMRACLLAFALFAFCAHAWAGWRQVLPDAQRCGQGDFRIYGFDIYSAQLWGRCSTAPLDAPFALQLTYHRSIGREKLVDSSLDEMKRLAGAPISDETLSHWRTLMEAAFVDVAPGDQLTGVFFPGEGVRFYADTRQTADIRDLPFAQAFFGIWLDPGTRAPALRNDLLRVRP